MTSSHRNWPLYDDLFKSEMSNEFMQDVEFLWLGPESARRQATGMPPMPAAVRLIGFQILLKGEETRVRFNDEIRGYVRFARPLDVDDDGKVLASEYIHTPRRFELLPDEFDYAHITMISEVGTGSFTLFSNPMTDRNISRQFVEHARAFLRVARLFYEEHLVGPCIDCLFSACELASKAHLLLAAHPAGRAKKHAAISSASNLASKTGRMPRQFVDLSNRMSSLRPVARYSVGHSDMLGVEQADLDLVAAELEWLAERCVTRDA